MISNIQPIVGKIIVTKYKDKLMFIISQHTNSEDLANFKIINYERLEAFKTSKESKLILPSKPMIKDGNII